MNWLSELAGLMASKEAKMTPKALGQQSLACFRPSPTLRIIQTPSKTAVRAFLRFIKGAYIPITSHQLDGPGRGEEGGRGCPSDRGRGLKNIEDKFPDS